LPDPVGIATLGIATLSIATLSQGFPAKNPLKEEPSKDRRE
jgi:hypothetical protein